MVREGMGFVLLLGQFSKVAVDVVRVAALGFQLDDHVFDTEVRGCAMAGLHVSSVACGSDQEIPVATAR
jgi:hypothetical protein